MTETIHRILMALGGSAAAIGGLSAGTGAGPLSAEVAGWLAFAGAAAVIVGNQIRVWWPTDTSP